MRAVLFLFFIVAAQFTDANIHAQETASKPAEASLKSDEKHWLVGTNWAVKHEWLRGEDQWLHNTREVYLISFGDEGRCFLLGPSESASRALDSSSREFVRQEATWSVEKGDLVIRGAGNWLTNEVKLLSKDKEGEFRAFDRKNATEIKTKSWKRIYPERIVLYRNKALKWGFNGNTTERWYIVESDNKPNHFTAFP